eukprot:gb/GFBE01019510.1/.p2 GENE.gb/GFBE01019510.1/~~gb/GFBE01019510.1/.p2  ORF type:complete len:188 (-),score=10.46 gb/GFBE01019510.1/:276-839(-)
MEGCWELGRNDFITLTRSKGGSLDRSNRVLDSSSRHLSTNSWIKTGSRRCGGACWLAASMERGGGSDGSTGPRATLRAVDGAFAGARLEESAGRALTLRGGPLGGEARRTGPAESGLLTDDVTAGRVVRGVAGGADLLSSVAAAGFGLSLAPLPFAVLGFTLVPDNSGNSFFKSRGSDGSGAPASRR